MPARTFVVTISESPSRVVVEDVRCRRRAVAADLAAVGGEIALLIETPPNGDDRPRGEEPLRPEEASP
jgi:hypothetical protein